MIKLALANTASRVREEHLLLNWPLIAILAVSVIVNSLGLNYGLPYPPPPNWLPQTEADQETYWVFDNLTPVTPLAAARDLFIWGEWSQNDQVYPLGHIMLLAAAFAPYMGYVLLSGGLATGGAAGYPYGLADPTTTLTVLTLIARSVSVLMGTGCVLAVYAITRELFDRTAALWAAACAALSGVLVFYSHTTNVDVPYVFWSLLALWGYARAMNGSGWKSYALLGAGTAMASATKIQSYGLFLLVPVVVLALHFRMHSRGPLRLATLVRALTHRNLLALGLAFGVTFVLAHNLIFNFPRFALLVERTINERDVDRILNPAAALDHWRLFGLTLDYLQRALGWPLFAVSVAGLAYCAVYHRRRAWPVMVPLFSFYALFIHGALFYVHARHVLPLTLLLVVFAGKLLADVLASTRVPKAAVRLGVTGVFAFSLLSALGVGLTLIHDSRYVAGDWLKANAPAGARVEVYSPVIFLPWDLNRYAVTRHAFAAATPEQLAERNPDFVIVTEDQYRNNADLPEALLLERASTTDPNLRALFSGQAGYRLRADFKFKLHVWFYPDMIWGQNPRLLIFGRATE